MPALDARPLALGFLMTIVLAPHDGHGQSAPHQEHGHRGHGSHGHGGTHGNPGNLEAYIAKMEDPSRDEWQKPQLVLEALGLRAGQTVCDIGTGPGYFALRFSPVVGPTGHVYAVDVEPRMLDALRERVRARGARNVTPVLALPDDPMLPDGACDLVLIVDTFHHLGDGPAYLRRVARALKPGGRIANIDFEKRETPVGPPVEHRVSREDFLAAAKKAGLQVVREVPGLPYQYFVLLSPPAK